MKTERTTAGETTGRIARVSSPRCNACGICREVCEGRAVRIGNVARIDTAKCTGCGACAERCPTEAIVMVEKRGG